MSIKISQLNSANIPLSGSETLILNQAGVTQSTLLSNIKSYIGSSTTSPSLSNVALSGGALIRANDNRFLFTVGPRPIQTPNNTVFIGFDAGAGATGASGSNFLGSNAGIGATYAFSSNFLGSNAGNSATYASGSNFLGNGAGNNATSASGSNFLGNGAGNNATSAFDSNFLGGSAGFGATYAARSNFLGNGAGYNATSASGSNFLGYGAGYNATSASYSNFLGNDAGYNATSASHSNFLGRNAGINVTGSHNNIFGQNSNVSPSSLSGCLVIGVSALATQNNTIALGSTVVPFLTSGSGTNTNSFMVVRLNGVNRKIPIWT